MDVIAHNRWHPCACTPHCQSNTQSTFAAGHTQRLRKWLKLNMEAGKPADWARREALSRGAGAGFMLQLEATIRRGGFK